MNEMQSMRAFVKVVEVGSFTEAAKQMGTTKSMIAKRINQLEEFLELELLQRSTRKINVTDTGVDFYERSSRILAEFDGAVAAVGSMEWGLSGTLKVSCISSFGYEKLAQDLCDFQKEHPELEIDFQQHDRFCDPVQEGFDVCLQPYARSKSILEELHVVPFHLLIVATKEYIEKYGYPKKPEDLKNHRFAHNTHISPDCKIHYFENNKLKSVEVKPFIRTNTVSMLRAAALNNECMVRLPVFYIEEELMSGELIPAMPELNIQAAYLSAFYRKAPYVPMKIKIFLNFLRRRYSSPLPWQERLVKKKPEFAEILDRQVFDQSV